MTLNFVDCKAVENLEEYGAALLSSIISLQTLEQFHVAAYKKGLLEEDEVQCSESIIGQIRKLIALYRKQIENIEERSPLDNEAVTSALLKMVPDFQLPKKRITKKKRPNDDSKD